jgi:hypothetical protein
VQAEIKPKEISVYICGCVKSPDVIKVKEGTRLDEAIEMVGGATTSSSSTASPRFISVAFSCLIYIVPLIMSNTSVTTASIDFCVLVI